MSSTKPATIRLYYPSALWLGIGATVLLTVSSFGAGATRNRGGIIEALGWTNLSFGHSSGLFSLFYWIGLVGLVLAWALLGRRLVTSTHPDSAERAHSQPRIVGSHILAWVAPLLLAGPLASRDVYSYLMQGAMVRDGYDPYTEGAAINPGPYLLEVSHDWRNTTTPYGPLHLWTGEIITSIVGDNVTAGVIIYKIISVLGFIAIAWAVPKIATSLGGNPALALWIGVANPVMILHMVGGMHNESVMVALVSVGLVCALRQRFIVAVALISVAVSLKATAAIALPFIVWMIYLHFRDKAFAWWRKIAIFVASGLAAVVETIAVVAAVTAASGSSWGWLTEITGNSKVVNPLALPTLVTDILFDAVLGLFDTDMDYNQVLSVARTVSSLVMLTCLVIIWAIFRQSPRRAVEGITTAYAVAFVTNSVTLPWYYASFLTLVGTSKAPMWVWKITTGASIVIALSFAAGGNHQLYNLVWVIAALIVAWVLTLAIFPVSAHIAYAADDDNLQSRSLSTPNHFTR